MQARMTNPRVVGIRAVILDGRQAIVMDQCHCSLADRITAWQQQDNAQPPMFSPGWEPEPSWRVLQDLLLQAALTLAVLHGRGPGHAIIHNDLRADNFLLALNHGGYELRLCDFGLAVTAAPDAGAGPQAAAAWGAWPQAPAAAAAAGGGPHVEAFVPAVTAVVQSLAPELWTGYQFEDGSYWYRVTGATDVFSLGGCHREIGTASSTVACSAFC
jgi:serine/threonine protein kinase